jgi:hypothetical protein
MNNSYIDKLKNNIDFRKSIVDALSGYDKLDISTDLEKFINNFIDNEIEKFREFENCFLYDQEDEVILLILPTIRRIYQKIYVSQPPILYNKTEKLELYKNLFYIEDFSNFLIKMIKQNRTSLSNFKNLDKTVELINLIVEDYVSYLLDKSLKIEDVKKELREHKIKKIFNK